MDHPLRNEKPEPTRSNSRGAIASSALPITLDKLEGVLHLVIRAPIHWDATQQVSVRSHRTGVDGDIVTPGRLGNMNPRRQGPSSMYPQPCLDTLRPE